MHYQPLPDPVRVFAAVQQGICSHFGIQDSRFAPLPLRSNFGSAQHVPLCPPFRNCNYTRRMHAQTEKRQGGAADSTSSKQHRLGEPHGQKAQPLMVEAFDCTKGDDAASGASYKTHAALKRTISTCVKHRYAHAGPSRDFPPESSKECVDGRGPLCCGCWLIWRLHYVS